MIFFIFIAKVHLYKSELTGHLFYADDLQLSPVLNDDNNRNTQSDFSNT